MMTRKSSAKAVAAKPPAVSSRSNGRNPRNRPTGVGTLPADLPPAPEQSPAEQQQDSEPLHPEPLLNPPYDPNLVQREIKNG
jgi:hypothetical protein